MKLSQDEDIGWLLWVRAGHLAQSGQFETEVERSIVESISDGAEHTVVDRLIGLWVAGRRESAEGEEGEEK